jgi:hypothetical protein
MKNPKDGAQSKAYVTRVGALFVYVVHVMPSSVDTAVLCSKERAHSVFIDDAQEISANLIAVFKLRVVHDVAGSTCGRMST